MVDYVFKEKGNDDLVAMNKLNHDVYDYSSYVKGSIYGNEFLTSHTDFAIPDYGNSPLQFVNQLGFTDEEWNRAGKVTVLRASVMTPYMNKEEHFEEYEKSKQLFKKNWKNLRRPIIGKRSKISKVIMLENSLNTNCF